MRHSPDVIVMLGQCLRHWPNITKTLGECPSFVVIPVFATSVLIREALLLSYLWTCVAACYLDLVRRVSSPYCVYLMRARDVFLCTGPGKTKLELSHLHIQQTFPSNDFFKLYFIDSRVPFSYDMLIGKF